MKPTKEEIIRLRGLIREYDKKLENLLYVLYPPERPAFCKTCPKYSPRMGCCSFPS